MIQLIWHQRTEIGETRNIMLRIQQRRLKVAIYLLWVDQAKLSQLVL